MKRIILILASFAATYTINAQVAKWILPPAYDAIYKAVGGDFIITDSVGIKGVWDSSGKCLITTDNQLAPFAEGISVSTKTDENTIVGFYDRFGKFTKLTDCAITYSHPYFSNGYLLVQTGKYFSYVNTSGEKSNEQFVKAWPFSNGYASCSLYEDIKKKKDVYHIMLTTALEPVSFAYQKKVFENEDINFISSVNDEKFGIVIAKNRAYWFRGDDKTLTPIYAKELETNNKNQARLNDDLSECLVSETDTTSLLKLSCGKTDKIQIRLDALLQPIALLSPYGNKIFKKHKAGAHNVSTSLKTTIKDGLYGINDGDQEMLPPQFENVQAYYGDKVAVKLKGKYGMLQILKGEKLKLSINKGNPIDFRHQKYETVLRLDLPPVISTQNVRIEIDPQTGCAVDLPSADKHDTKSGNYIQYNCVLSIPDSLPDEMTNSQSNDIIYPAQVVYDELRSSVIPIKVKAWHYKYFNVDIIHEVTTVNLGDVSFTFNINAERKPGESVYPTSVNILADTLTWDLEKMSETRYKCRIFGLAEGVNNIVIQVLEQGCPPASFPFEITYTKPVAKAKNKPEVKESVSIVEKRKKKKSPSPTPALTPYLEI